ncbi:DUF1127 domain-containing protein [Oceanibaculum nanhaiense]|uniref:DUF1127 domain-containing protein n=1 Tax=Oceanibaculum nanhaiense TaxID=1909734 RepID=UPI003D29EE1B
MATVMMKTQPASARMPARMPRIGVRSLIFDLLSWLADAQSRASSRYELRDLDARQLRDVGLTRAELDRAFGPTFWMIR